MDEIEMDITKIVLKVLVEYLLNQEISEAVDENTYIYGEGGVLDSMGVVNLIVDLESYFLDKGIELNLTSEKALSLNNSPFRSVNSLAEFILSQMK